MLTIKIKKNDIYQRYSSSNSGDEFSSSKVRSIKNKTTAG